MSAEEPDDHAHDHAHEHGEHDHAHDEVLVPIKPTEHGYWRSLKELEGQARYQLDPAAAANEFLTPPDRVIDPMHRRNFFQLMGASMALAGVSACRYEKEEIVPLAKRPEDQTPGITQQYATAFDLGGVGHALVATSFEGRPIHLDGNPEHPFASGGAVPGTQRHAGITTFAQASILHLYDPDRSQNPTSGGKGASMDGFRSALPELRKHLSTTRILAEASSSPTVAYLRDRLIAANPGLQWHEYEPISWDNEREGTRKAFNQPARPIARLDKCETIVTIDCDLFVEHPAAMKYGRDFARSRRMNGSLGVGKMNRLYTVESTFTNTGAMADHRLPLRSEFGLPFAMALDSALGGGAASGAEFLKEKKVADFVRELVKELQLNHGRAVVIAGRRQSADVHALVARINQSIGAPGATLDYHFDRDPQRVPHVQAISDLATALKTPGAVSQLIILGGNPVYDGPADLELGKLIPGVPTSIHLHEYQNETSKKTTWHLPKAHFLEAWGDARTWDGTVTIAQPLIAPLYGGLSSIEFLSLLLGEEKVGDTLVQDAHATLGVTASWRQSVHDGFVPTVLAPANLTVGNFSVGQPSPSQLGGSKRANGDLEVVFHYSSFSYDGRFANNAWLQETPDFLTKVTWDNYALVGPETATTLGLENDTMITVKIDGRSVDLPCHTIPGQARFSIGLVLGGGRTAAGRVGGDSDHTVGWDTNKVRTVAGFEIAGKATVTPTGKSYELASVQEHWDIRTGIIPKVNTEGLQARLPELIRETTMQTIKTGKDAEGKDYRAEEPLGYFTDPKRAGNNDGPVRPGGLSLFKEKDYTGHRWGMAIDLNTCMGCNACMVACQSENNVPVVGREEIFHDREMHWIRIDRYFSGSPEEPHVVHQPVGCQQCEQAPCETVCPVGATSHSDEGLNDMAYNRCIGTRYCANNCPYKVRKFNFLDWNKEWRDARNRVRRLIFNPDVTVRMRGVMEKCTFCVQRIQNGKIKAKAQIRSGMRPGTVGGPLPDGEIETACQEACPTEAIVFGDLSDPASRVSQLSDDNRSYALLPELYTKPRNRFLSRVRNLNPALAGEATSKGEGH